MALKPLFSACRKCKEQPAFRTRQRAIGARSAGAWYQVCAEHRPGSGLAKLAETRPELAEHLSRMKAHEIEPIEPTSGETIQQLADKTTAEGRKFFKKR